MESPFHNGYFVFSLDTELALGFFDLDKRRRDLFQADGKAERQKVSRLLSIFEEFDICATWAIVGHMFFDHCEKCNICPIEDWKGRFSSYDEVYGTNNPLWYGADVISMIQNSNTRHEIGFHGYTHEVFKESQMSRSRAEIEICEWQRVANRYIITPTSIVFPRDRVGHLAVFKDHGFLCYRSEEKIPRMLEMRPFGPWLKTLDHLCGISIPPVYGLDKIHLQDGLVSLQASQHLFGFNRNVELFLDSHGLELLRFRRMSNGIKKAASEKKMIHLWAHPWEFRTEKDFQKLRFILGAVKEEVSRGAMQSIGMSEMSKIILGESA